MQIQAHAACDIGLARESNEDRFLVDHELNLLAVSDGMGGHAAGEIAATRCLEISAEYFRQHGPVKIIARASPKGYYRVLQLAEDALEEASRRIYKEASANRDYAGMGATLTILMVVDDKGIMAHVGDSRSYLLRDGKMHLLSNDHTMAHEFYLAGVISREEAQMSRYANALTRVMNIASINHDASGQAVISKGEPCEGVYIVLSGGFTQSGGAGSPEILRAGDWFAAGSLLHKQTSRQSIGAKSPSRMLQIAGSDFDRLTRRQPKLGRRLLRRLCQYLSEELGRDSDGVDLSDTVDL